MLHGFVFAKQEACGCGDNAWSVGGAATTMKVGQGFALGVAPDGAQDKRTCGVSAW